MQCNLETMLLVCQVVAACCLVFVSAIVNFIAVATSFEIGLLIMTVFYV